MVPPVVVPRPAPTNGAAPSPAGTWDSELGRVTIVDEGGKLTGYWERQSTRRGEFTKGQLQGLTLTLDYITAPDNLRGTAVFTWNPRSNAWEGNWLHSDGRGGGWNLRMPKSAMPQDQSTVKK